MRWRMTIDSGIPIRSSTDFSNATTSRAAYARHPWAPQLVDTRSSAGPGRLASFDATIGCLRRAGFPHALIVHALSTLDAYVHGFAAHRLHIAQAEVPDDVAMAEALAQWLPKERYPALAALVQEHVLVDGYDEDEGFSATKSYRCCWHMLMPPGSPCVSTPRLSTRNAL